MKSSRKSKITHLLRAMVPGDVIYLPETIERLDKQITAAAARNGWQLQTSCFIAFHPTDLVPCRLVRVTKNG